MKQALSLFAAGAALLLTTGIASAQEEDPPKEDSKDESKEDAKPSETTSSKSDADLAADADAEDAAAEASARAAADAQLPKEKAADTRKIRLGLRLGYGLPLGEATKGQDLSQLFSGILPIWIDAGYMVTPSILLGIYFQYGLGFVGDCPEGAECSVSDIRFGIQGQYRLSPGENLDPWVGLGIGYEIAPTSQTTPAGERSASFKGLEFLNIQGGADFALSDTFTVGPFLSFSLGQYSSVGLEPAEPGYGGSIQDKGLHQWLLIGVKGTLAL